MNLFKTTFFLQQNLTRMIRMIGVLLGEINGHALIYRLWYILRSTKEIDATKMGTLSSVVQIDHCRLAWY